MEEKLPGSAPNQCLGEQIQLCSQGNQAAGKRWQGGALQVLNRDPIL